MAEFWNVYNFIPFPPKKAARYEDADRHTGYIEYRITTKTPLFIPNTSSEHAFRMGGEVPAEHKSYDFFSYREMDPEKTYDDESAVPVLPGSELRGMVRGIYETLTDSCMGVLNGDERPVKRTSQMFQAGLLHRGTDGLELVAAVNCVGPSFRTVPYKEGQKLYFVKQSKGNRLALARDCQTMEDAEHPDCGYLIKGMPSKNSGRNQKRNSHIFCPNGNPLLRMDRVSAEKEYHRLKEVLKSYQDQPDAEKNSYKEYEEQLDSFWEERGEEYFPVYYSFPNEKQDDRFVYLAPACFTKELSHHTIRELAKDMVPCLSVERVCPACDLFGRVGSDHKDSQASKLRFTDAYVEKETGDYYDPAAPVTLEALGEPKLGNTEFYLYQPDGADFWTYDYYVSGEEVILQPGRLRGRKYYWHQPKVQLRRDIEKTKLNKTVRPVRSGLTFVGKVYFDGISEKQLRQLQWILDCGGKKSDLAYKLGAGKPLGLGSVECRVSDIQERTVALNEGTIVYREATVQSELRSYEELGFSESCKKEFLRMIRLHTADGAQQISYPVTAEQVGKPMTEGFQWFVRNHDTGKMITQREKMRNYRALPLADAISSLPCLEAKKASAPGVNLRPGGDRTRKPKPRKPKPRVGERFTAEISGHKPGKNGMICYLLIKIKGGRKASLACWQIAQKENKKIRDWETAYPVGTRVEVEYGGQNEQNYDMYEYVGKA